ncbi:MAG TPA: mannose-1-phosphate guanylyltransferase, partial [Hyphomonadaceae bacterium]|nr:mannose-1-phosphate guanylyltransferase [Hyphomonadaceae bacterium]
PWAYAGARITKASLYDGEALRPFSANIIWNRILTENRLFGLPFKGQWMHVGEPATIQEVEDWMRTHRAA